MNPLIRSLLLGTILATATAANALTNPLSGSAYGSAIKKMPVAPPIHARVLPLGPGPASPVSPVPEPSEWMMMLAGMALVGFIVRRNSRG